MNDKKPLMDYRRVQKLQTPLLLTGALLSGVGTSVSVPLVILGIAIMLFAIVIGVLYYRCPHCGRPLGRMLRRGVVEGGYQHAYDSSFSFSSFSPALNISPAPTVKIRSPGQAMRASAAVTLSSVGQ